MKYFLNLLLALNTLVATAGMGAAMTMPPSFSWQADPGTVLRDYPLGTITKSAAFSHHGKAIRVLALPNGEEGWVYEVRGKQTQTYQHPTAEKHTVYESAPGNNVHTYTLVFDDKGVVVDVLYNEQGPHDGLTALQAQLKKRGEGGIKGKPPGVR